MKQITASDAARIMLASRRTFVFTCSVCDDVFTAQSTRARYCSKQCAKRAEYVRRRDRLRQP